ncbi:hypothetical protein DPMN_100994 [Dreissena polymorpha]|uniref:Uncharacterized protein n=1 Tax=Dreissena polymorpha TaxID=45954 RepID=A0A9D4LK94_DREPO|nr:hypothetical protein DPMN_100994 [Dreissena polymorpha]
MIMTKILEYSRIEQMELVRVSSKEECIKNMMQLFGSYDIIGVHEENRLFAMASKDVQLMISPMTY